MAEAQEWKVAVSLTIMLLSLRVTLQDFICPSMCECDELILTVNCGETFHIRPNVSYNVSSLTSVLLLDGNDLVNVSEILPWERLGNMRKLSLASNRIEAFESGTLSFMEGLLYIDISNNSLYSVPSELRALTNVRYLDLSDNSIIFIETNDFANFEDLATLKLTNSLKVIARGSFSPLSHIKSLTLSGSDFSSIRGCLELGSWFSYSSANSSLEEINLSNSNVCLSDNTFTGFRHLKIVNLSSNNIQVLPETLLRGHSHIRKLDLSDNSISDIPVEFFFDSRALQFLNISINYLTSAENVIVESLRRLKHLDLAKNYISEPSPLDFRIFRNLRELILRNNKIREFPVVHNLRHLEFLDLSMNSIREISSTALKYCIRLREVRINRNYGLTSFEPDTINLESMYTFSMKYNGIYCDCNLLEYFELERSKHGGTLPDWLSYVFGTEKCKMAKFEDNFWYDAVEFLSQYMICSHYTPPGTIAIMVGSWLTIVVSIVICIWLRSMCSAKRKWHSKSSTDPGGKYKTWRRTRTASTGQVPARSTMAGSSAAAAGSQPVWEEKEKLLSHGRDSSTIVDAGTTQQPPVRVVIVHFEEDTELDGDITEKY